MIVGAHARNEVEIQTDDVHRANLAMFSGMVVMSYQGPLAAATYGVSPHNCVVRLQDSVYKSWPSGEEYVPHWARYAEDVAEQIDRFYTFGYRKFQVDNEPNLTWPQHRMGPWQWSWFMNNALFDPREGVLALLRAEGIEDAEIGVPPLSHPDLYPEWVRVIRETRLGSLPWVSAHCYWQKREHMFSEQFGSNFLWLSRQFPNKPILITECGNSLCQAQPPPPLSEIRARQEVEYAEYLRWVERYPVVGGLYFYMLGHNGDWEGFDLTERICRSIGCAQLHRVA